MLDECNNTDEAPSAREYFNAISTTDLALTVTCAFLTVLTSLLYAESLLFVNKRYTGHFRLRVRTSIILTLFPSVSVCALLVLVFPRSSMILDLVTSICISFAVHNFVLVLVEYFKSVNNLVQECKGDKVPLGVMPCPAFALCGLSVHLSWKSCVVMLVLGLQSVLIQPLIAIMSIVLQRDGLNNKQFAADDAYPYLATLNVCSTVTTIYGVRLLIGVTRPHLPDLHLRTKFIAVQLVLLSRNFQSVILQSLARTGYIVCEGIVSATVRADRINQMMTIAEVFLLGMCARYLYRKTEHTLKRDESQREMPSAAHAPTPTSSQDSSEEKSGEANLAFESDIGGDVCKNVKS